jgi:hypothetical protein
MGQAEGTFVDGWRAARTMTTAIDTNLWWHCGDKDPTLRWAAQTALEAAFNREGLVVSASVLRSCPRPKRIVLPARRGALCKPFTRGANRIPIEPDAVLVKKHMEFGIRLFRQGGEAVRSRGSFGKAVFVVQELSMIEIRTLDVGGCVLGNSPDVGGERFGIAPLETPTHSFGTT